MGITRTGRFAAITNHRNPPSTPALPRSRGLLTLDFLAGGEHPADYLAGLEGPGRPDITPLAENLRQQRIEDACWMATWIMGCCCRP